jgi:hypothetical protein
MDTHIHNLPFCTMHTYNVHIPYSVHPVKDRMQLPDKVLVKTFTVKTTMTMTSNEVLSLLDKTNPVFVAMAKYGYIVSSPIIEEVVRIPIE